MTKIVETILSSVGSTMKAPVCKTEVELDLRSQFIRTAEVGSRDNPTEMLMSFAISVHPPIGLRTSLGTRMMMPSASKGAGVLTGSSYVRAPYEVIPRTDRV